MFYTRPAAWKKFGSQVKVAHFTGFGKPWKHRMTANDEAISQAIDRLESSNTVYTTAEQTGVLALWWAVFFKRVKHQLSYGMFLSTTFEPIPPPPPPSPQDNWQENSEFGWQIGNYYHPEFSDNSFDFLHTGQRVDESNRYEKYHEFFEPPKPLEPEHHKHYQSHHHESHDHQAPVYNDHHQHHHSEYHQQPPPPQYYEPLQPSSSPQPEYHHNHHQEYPHHHHHEEHYHQENRHEGHHECYQEQPQQQQWQGQPHYEHDPRSGHAPPPPLPVPMEQPCEQNHEESREVQHYPPPRQPSPSRHREPSPPPPSPEPRNDKDPLFFAQKPMCRECLRELQWSRQFIDPFHRDISFPVSPTRSTSRVRRRSLPKGLPGPQIIRGMSKKSPTPSISTAPDEGTSKISTKEPRKREKESEKSLHQVQKGKSVSKKRLKKPIDPSKLVEAAKRRIQAKTETRSPQALLSSAEDLDNNLIEPMAKIETTLPKAELRAAIKNSVEEERKEPRTLPEITSAAVLKNALTKSRSEVDEDDRLEDIRPRLGTVTPPASVTRAKRQNKPLSDSEKAQVEELLRAKIASKVSTSAKRHMELSETEEEIKPKAHSKLESEPAPIKSAEKSTKKAPKLKSPSLSKTEETETSKEVKEKLSSKNIAKKQFKDITKSKPMKEAEHQKSESKERKKKTESESMIEKPAVDSTPWLPRHRKRQNRSQKVS
ncbi:unnamed protein product [Hymenolepis diminuta]|uniref:PWWP domain-containing protein n=1 Tax=Hymenolepis diminuta TaxID=6216 RepID=A0A0R3SWS1_HYMDI|nr:unnamed protein product [Hymenolepis diminuta]